MTNLFSYITGYTSGGTWTNESYPSTPPTITSGNVNFASLPNGVYVFKYTVTSTSCTMETLLTITKVGVTLTNTSTTCTKSIGLHAVSNNDTNKMDVYTLANDKYIYGKVNGLINSTCSANVIKEFTNQIPAQEYARGKLYLTHTIPAVTNTYVKSLQIVDSISNTTVNIDLNPTTTPYLNPALPCTSPVTQTQLYFGQTGLPTQLRQLIMNAMCVLYGATADNYEVVVTTNSNTIFIKLACKNTPSSLWVGIPSTKLAVYNNTSIDVTSTAAFEVAKTNIEINENVGCTTSLVTNPYVTFTVDTVTSSYVNIVLLNNIYTITGDNDLTPVLSTTCNNYTLVATVNATCVFESYTWLKNGNQLDFNTNTIEVDSNATGTYTVIVNCDDCQKSVSVTI